MVEYQSSAVTLEAASFMNPSDPAVHHHGVKLTSRAINRRLQLMYKHRRGVRFRAVTQIGPPPRTAADMLAREFSRPSPVLSRI